MSETGEGVMETPKKNKGGRPRKVGAPSGPTFSDDQFQQLIAVLAAKPPAEGAVGGVDLEALKTLLEGTAKVSATAMQKAMKPENDTHPGKSALSYPEGDVARPRPVPRCEIFWNGFPIHKNVEVHHYLELELLNQLEPGEYQVMRKDGTPDAEKIKVDGVRDADGRLSKLDVKFSISREERHYIAPMAVMLYQMTHANLPLRRSFMEGWRLWMEVVMGDVPVAV